MRLNFKGKRKKAVRQVKVMADNSEISENPETSEVSVQLKNTQHPVKVRQHIIFYGNVQGVGFRYRSVYAARSLGLTGWVRNEWDGTVEMEVQGSKTDIYKMIAMINKGNYVMIENMKAKNIPLEDHEYDFRVV